MGQPSAKTKEMVMVGKYFDHLKRIFLCGVKSVQPEALFKNILRCSVENGRKVVQIRDEKIDLTGKNLNLIGFGKAVLGMAVQIESSLKVQSGILSVPTGSEELLERTQGLRLALDSKIKVYEGAKDNLPDENAMAAARKIRNLAEKMTSKDILLVLISGGGSALLPLPVESISLKDKLSVIKELTKKGATIEELNIVRISLSDIKGGKLGMLAKNAHKVISFVLSDIVGDPLHLIASGPTIPFVRGLEMAKSVLEKYSVWEKLPSKIQNAILNETLEPQMFGNASVYVVGNNLIAIQNCFDEATLLGYNSFILSTTIQGNVKDLAESYADFINNIKLFVTKKLSHQEFLKKITFAKEKANEFIDFLIKSWENRRPICLILGGEPTVKVQGSGKGGRNQELALRMSLMIHKNRELNEVFFLSAGTDGIDGPTNAAGAFGGSEIIAGYLQKSTCESCIEMLENNDSFTFYRDLSGGKYHVITGHTGTNVMDLHLILMKL